MSDIQVPSASISKTRDNINKYTHKSSHPTRERDLFTPIETDFPITKSMKNIAGMRIYYQIMINCRLFTRVTIRVSTSKQQLVPVRTTARNKVEAKDYIIVY